MNQRKTNIKTRHIASSILMLIALFWLTVSTPFVYEHQKQMQKMEKKSSEKTSDNSNSLTNTNEEKTETGVNTLSEYIHDHHFHLDHPTEVAVHGKCSNSDLYLAFHPELNSPPPEG